MTTTVGGQVTPTPMPTPMPGTGDAPGRLMLALILAAGGLMALAWELQHRSNRRGMHSK